MTRSAGGRVRTGGAGCARLRRAGGAARQRQAAHDALDDVVDDRGDAALEVPPDAGGRQHRGADEQQADAVATVRGVEVASAGPGAVPDPAYPAAEQVGDPQPQAGEEPTDAAREADDPAGAGLATARGWALSRATLGGAALGGTRGGRRAAGGSRRCGPTRRAGAGLPCGRTGGHDPQASRTSHGSQGPQQSHAALGQPLVEVAVADGVAVPGALGQRPSRRPRSALACRPSGSSEQAGRAPWRAPRRRPPGTGRRPSSRRPARAGPAGRRRRAGRPRSIASYGLSGDDEPGDGEVPARDRRRRRGRRRASADLERAGPSR